MSTHLTPFEDLFCNLTPGQRPSIARGDTYDPEYALFHSPPVARAEAVAHGPTGLPEVTWVQEAFARMVVGEAPKPVTYARPPAMSQSNGRGSLRVSMFPIDRYIEACEEELVFGGLVDNLIGDPMRPSAEKLVSIVADRRLGNTANRRNVHPDMLAARLEASERKRTPVQLLLPAMPFKDQCAFRTESGAEHVDLGEIAFLVRLHCLVLAINQIHRYDAECVVISDGTAYAPIFDVELGNAIHYLESLRLRRNLLNLGKSIHLIHLSDLVDLDIRWARSQGFRDFHAVRRSIRADLEHLIAYDRSCERAFYVLAYGMRWNLNTRRYLTSTSPTDLWRALRRRREHKSDSAALRDLSHTIAERAHAAALDYAAFNLAMSYTNLLERYFPDAVRLTSHPKPGQVAAPRLGSVYPWNGVAAVDSLDESQISVSSISCIEAHVAMRDRLLPVFEQGSQYPICYTKGGKDRA